MRTTSPHDPHLEEYLRAIGRPPREWDLFDLFLHISRIGDPGPGLDDCLEEVRVIRRKVEERLPSQRDPYTIIEHANAVLYEELGYRGNTENYYDPLNSLMSQVLRRRTGIPITLSVLYQEIVGRLGLETWELECPDISCSGFRPAPGSFSWTPFTRARFCSKMTAAPCVVGCSIRSWSLIFPT